jgi:shikimate kinase
MTDDSRIWLIGLMGCGKSTVGRALARSLGYTYIDNDLTIHELAGRSTVDLAAAGNGNLHEWESRYVRHVASLPPTVVAGIPASAADRAADLRTLTATGHLVYLKCDLNTLVSRIEADEPRPWVQQNVQSLIAGMLAAREPALMTAADLIVDGTAPVADSVTRITGALRVTSGEISP